MTVPHEVNPLHRSYMDLSARYKAAWTYHRFVEGLRKFFGNRDVADYPADFQSLYGELKEVSLRLNDPAPQRQMDSLRRIEEELALLLGALEQEDRKISPTHLRLFFQRAKSQDERILIDLVRFYQEIQAQATWEEDRIDKVDFLLTRLGEKILGAEHQGDRNRLNRILDGIAGHREEQEATDPQKLANRQKMIRAVRTEIRQVDDLDELTEKDLVAHYRRVKHGLASLLFERTILPLVVDTNLVMAARVRELSVLEEERLLADYERVSELEEQGRLDRHLAAAVASLHHEIAEFQKQLSAGNVRLLNLLAMRNSVQETLSRLEGSDQSHVAELPLDAGVLTAGDARASVDRILLSGGEQELLGQSLTGLLEGLIETEGSGGASSALVPFRLEQREHVAFARLRGSDPCDQRTESFLLAAAALRHRINREVEEIHAYRSSTATDDAPAPRRADQLLRLGDWYLRQFAHRRETRLLKGNLERAAELQRLRMRLMRDYSGLWLVANPG